MTYEEVKQNILDNMQSVYSIVIKEKKEDVFNILDFIFKKLDIVDQDPEKREPLEQEDAKKINTFINDFLESLIMLNRVYTEDIRNTSLMMSYLFDILVSVYPLVIYPLCIGSLLRTLLKIETNLEAQLDLNMYLISHIKNIIGASNNNPEGLLSRRYYEELVSFLDRRNCSCKEESNS